MLRVRTGDPFDHTSLATVVAGAFADDPLMVWLLADAGDRQAATRRWWGPLIAGYLGAGRALVTNDQRACLFWRHSSERIPDAPGQPPMDEVITGLVAPERRPQVGTALGVFHRLRPAEPHVYVHVVATSGDRQGQGHGTQLLDALAATAPGALCCLESTNPRNHSFYVRNGFTAGAAAMLPGSDVTATSFSRRATAS